MTRDEIRNTVIRLLSNIAPEADAAQLRPNVSLREQLDIDSMDFLSFMIALHKELQVEIPERDYPQLVTIDGCVNYLTNSLAARIP